VLVVALVVGIFFRFYNIDRKVYWDDEIFSSLHILGYTEAGIVRDAPRIVDGKGLRAVLHPDPSTALSGVSATLDSLASEDPQHSPLYYVAGHFWVQLFGSSVATIRTLSAVAGVIALPAMFWLCLELFSSSVAACMGTALLAISPFAVLYSQEAREYSFWTVAILLMSASFLRAVRTGTTWAWALYAASFTFGLYIFPLSGFIALGQAAFLFATRGSLAKQTRYRASLAYAAGLVLFAPWFVLVAEHLRQAYRSMATVTTTKIPPVHIAGLFLAMVRLDTLDLNSTRHAVLISLPVLLSIVYALYVVKRYGRAKAWLFIAMTMLCCTLPLVFADLAFSGQRTDNPRYFLPLYLGIDLAITGLFLTKIVNAPASVASSRAWRLAFVCILVVRLYSCAASSQAETWWNKREQQSIAVARAINRAPHPIILGDDYIEWALSLANYLRPDVGVALNPRCFLCSDSTGTTADLRTIEPPNDYRAIFLLAPSAVLQDRVKDVMRARGVGAVYRCIDVRSNCSSRLSLW